MKMDKEFVVKQKFWLLLSGAAFFTLVGIFFLFFIAPRATAKLKVDIENKWKPFKTVGDVKNEKFVEKARKEAEIEEKKKTVVWANAADQQKPLITWPRAIEDEFAFTNGNRATEIVIQAKDAKLDTLPEDDLDPLSGTHRFHGKLTRRTAEWIEVTGRPRKGAKDTQPLVKKFYRTSGVKILTPEDKDKGIDFPKLQEYDDSLPFVAVTYDRGMYSYDDLTNSEQDKFASSYRSQIMDVLKEAGPRNELDGVLVQFRDWSWQKGTKAPPKEARFFHWVDEWKRETLTGGTQDLSEEAWLAQEDLWIYRELFRLVKKANDYVAEFEPLASKAKADPSKFTGENPYWKLTLSLVDGNKVKLKITNKLDRLQTLDVRFAAKVKADGRYVVLPPLNGEPLLPAAAPRGKDTFEQTLDLPGYPAKGIYGVRQVLTWDTAAVRRIDEINIGTDDADECALSHRLANKKLLPFRKKEEAAAVDEKDGKKADMMMRQTKSGKQVLNRTLNGLVRDRYLEKTDQSRRVPVSIALIVDQSQVARVQAAFANSALRFLTTQMLLQRYPHSLRPPEELILAADSKDGPGPMGTTANPMPMPMPGRPPFYTGAGRPGSGRFGERFPGAMPGYPSSGTMPSAGGSDEEESNVELVLYGVVSIYERFPPRRASAANPPTKH